MKVYKRIPPEGIEGKGVDDRGHNNVSFEIFVWPRNTANVEPWSFELVTQSFKN